jgi:DNA (cytosine-5)-methyltransferase 1
VDQLALPFGTRTTTHSPAVLDLFAGTGGLSCGFTAAGFRVTGVDSDPASGAVFAENRIGELLLRNLHDEQVIADVPVVIGGPPCRPWSAVNLKRRGSDHEDHGLVERFFEHLRQIKPAVFLMENVPPLIGDPTYRKLVDDTRWRGYSVAAQVLQYSDFGASTTRKRLFTVGFQGANLTSAEEFFQRLTMYHRSAATVRDAIGWLEGQEAGAVPDHEWSAVNTIAKYADRYRTGQYGWRQLDWDKPAPSFGSVSKTYVLHPASPPELDYARVLSVREVLSILGFDRDFRFPPGIGLSVRYRMAANAVSPIVSEACARVIHSMLFSSPDSSFPEHASPNA